MIRAVAILFLLLQSHDPAMAQDGAQVLALVGRWSATTTHSTGARLAATMTLTQSMRFTGSISVDDKPYWDFSGAWSLSGSALTFRYETSTHPQIPPGTVDTDDVVSVDGSTLVLVSRLSGRRQEYLRVR